MTTSEWKRLRMNSRQPSSVVGLVTKVLGTYISISGHGKNGKTMRCLRREYRQKVETKETIISLTWVISGKQQGVSVSSGLSWSWSLSWPGTSQQGAMTTKTAIPAWMATLRGAHVLDLQLGQWPRNYGPHRHAARCWEYPGRGPTSRWDPGTLRGQCRSLQPPRLDHSHITCPRYPKNKGKCQGKCSGELSTYFSHKFGQCLAKEAKCKICQKISHYTKVYRSKYRKTKQNDRSNNQFARFTEKKKKTPIFTWWQMKMKS